MALPFLPGYTFKSDIGREDYPLGQHLAFENGLPYHRDEVRFPKIYSCAKSDLLSNSKKPAWDAFFNRVLCFHAFFYEPIHLISQTETYRYRKCKIYYYLADDTMEIIEPAQHNSAIPQGTMFKRHKFKKPGFETHQQYYTYRDLNINKAFEIYGRSYKIVDCDQFTKTFMAEAGLVLNDPVQLPEEARDLPKFDLTDRKNQMKKDKLRPFLKYHPQTLRFYGVWNDHPGLHGESRKFVLHYFLADDTIEIIELKPNDFDSTTSTEVFLRKGPLPKVFGPLPLIGENTNVVVLNMSGRKDYCDKYVVDSSHSNIEDILETKFYKATDLDIGIIVNVLGRALFIYDCDEFTKKYFQLVYGKELKPITLVEDGLRPVLKREVYPSSIFTGARTAVENCPPKLKKDIRSYNVKRRYGMDCPEELRFSARIITDDAVKKTRQFIITFFCADSTFQIFEPMRNNPGIQHGKIMMRRKVQKPESKEPYVCYYGLEDLFIGNTLRIIGEDFLLTASDPNVYEFMEKNNDTFVYSNFNVIMGKLKNYLGEKAGLIKAYFENFDFTKHNYVLFEDFKKAIIAIIGPEILSEQEIITIARHYADPKKLNIRLQDVLSAAQTKLRQQNYDDFDNLQKALEAYDIQQTGLFTKEDLYFHLRSCRLKLSPFHLKAVLYKFPSPDGKHINYNDLLFALNYFKNPAPLAAGFSDINSVFWDVQAPVKSMENIDYVSFTNDLMNNNS